MLFITTIEKRKHTRTPRKKERREGEREANSAGNRASVAFLSLYPQGHDLYRVGDALVARNGLK